MMTRHARLLSLCVPIALVAAACEGSNGLFKPGALDVGPAAPDATPGSDAQPGGAPGNDAQPGGAPGGDAQPGGGVAPDAFVLDDTGVKDASVDPPDLGPPECTPGDVAECADPAACAGGSRTCDATGHFGPCVGPAEQCNSRDDDCDGRVDEAFPDLGQDCASGVGACSARGQYVCNASRDATQCNATAGAATAEVCDGIDNDCDGQTDNDPTGGPLSQPCYGADAATLGVGACAEGARYCMNAAFGDCLGAIEPAEETCNASDDDCDGFTDEGIDGAPLIEPCYDGPAGTAGVGACAGGESACINGIPGACGGQVLPGVEVCDTVDNDCTGAVDDVPAGVSCACAPGEARACYTGAPETLGVGACVGGTQRCTDAGVFGPCEGERRAAAEACNGVDDDCDGVTDDSVPGTGIACSVGRGACAADGETVCDSVAGAVLCGAVAGTPEAERCDEIDNDCDGRTDNGLGLGEACGVGVGACAAQGVRVCDEVANVACSARPGTPVGELCNSADDDCDGAVDEDLGLGDTCTLGLGVCAAQGVLVCARDGGTFCNAIPSAPGAEACNGLDDDCDGVVDQGNPGGGQPCDTGLVGACGVGATQCAGGGFTCVETVQPTAEVCDGVDNDCDGLTDEDEAGLPLAQDCYEGGPGTLGIGQCAGGVQHCEAGQFGACIGQVLPVAEFCDTVDNDCDGQADDGLGNSCVCVPGETRACYSGPPALVGVGACARGVQTCSADGTGFGPCQGEVLPGGETCDGLDNDCDGQVDDVAGLGSECGAGRGVCAATGTLQCDTGRGLLVCDAQQGTPSAELCDGLDNDCNGVIDDVPGLGEACTNGVGACAGAGNRVCDRVTGGLVCTGVAGQPVAEVCNGVDDDCDGATDDGIAGTGLICTAGVGGCFRQGVTVCGGAQGITCSQRAGDPSPEVCNGVDDNCNGVVDDAPVDVDVACSSGNGGCAVAGVTQCRAGVLSCSAVARPAAYETCNGLDDDCDGLVDEGATCLEFVSCLDALRQGWRETGIFRLRAGDVVREVLCDQVSDGGGWTLVGSTRSQTLNDQSSAWYDDLKTLAPANANAGVWTGMRLNGVQFWDTRLACRQQQAAESAAMAVDLTFYGTNWYGTWTSGTDADSCFAPDVFQDRNFAFTRPARRNNLTGAYAPLGTSYNPGRNDNDRGIVGEDTCNDASDFTVDYSNRGMDSNETDGTDWGEDDERRKCGNQNDVDGQWFVFARESRGLAVAGSYTLGEGPAAGTRPVPQSCVETCAARFGGNAADYQCSRSGVAIDRRAYVDGVRSVQFCADQGSGAADTFERGAVYDTNGGEGSAYSAYVNDHEGCRDRRNYCWRWQ